MAALEAVEHDLRARLRQEQISKERLQSSHTRILQEREDTLKRRLQEMDPLSRPREENLVEILKESHRLLEDECVRVQQAPQLAGRSARVVPGVRGVDCDFQNSRLGSWP